MNEHYKKEVPKPLEQQVEKSETDEVRPTTEGDLEVPTPATEGKQQEQPAATESFQDEFERLQEQGEGSEGMGETELQGLQKKVEERSLELDSKMDGEQGQLDEVRARLSMPQVKAGTTHAGKALEREKEDLNELRGNIAGKLGSDKEGAQESAERMSRLRKNVEEVGESLQSFAAEIQQRAKNGMDPFFDERAFGSLKGGFNALKSVADGTGKLSSEELATALGQVNFGLEKMAQTRQGGSIRESEESLGKLSFRAQQLTESLSSMSRNLEENDDGAHSATRRLSETSERARVFTGRLRGALRQMR